MCSASRPKNPPPPPKIEAPKLRTAGGEGAPASQARIKKTADSSPRTERSDVSLGALDFPSGARSFRDLRRTRSSSLLIGR